MKELFLIFIGLFLFMSSEAKNTEKATLGAGCFWCVEAIYDQLEGVISVESGYSGGHVDKPSYKQVCNGNTGHAEVCQITYDADIISFGELLTVFWSVHDPTTLNRQGADVGTQYRSVIFYHNEDQKRIAEEQIKVVNEQKLYKDPIVTEVTAFANFFVAEDYHQEYFANNPNQGYCRMVVGPKVEKFQKLFTDQLKK
ncbi:peptide-methionine (S)-S-oxide reductase MsrA [Saccharicrinis fermentans]|uniref:Peptide methionine sulfoxide reductase MsrA n=1 Tax=Saccharicrinis fermentans DSM 9555 = JCM 21142 TaxID=869213 RepID=W7YIF6_9BACT|nr:peptide-methionine (S)-S-oxide reductase MsrA [Saccharicrinis fermentans]GAF04261.1 peptide methionine sulfoxide reductase MsrA [Saccharicrinis fermentans DSM 9555 = JCM 21142]